MLTVIGQSNFELSNRLIPSAFTGDHGLPLLLSSTSRRIPMLSPVKIVAMPVFTVVKDKKWTPVKEDRELEEFFERVPIRACVLRSLVLSTKRVYEWIHGMDYQSSEYQDV